MPDKQLTASRQVYRHAAKTWKTEHDKLAAERQQLSHHYSALKDEVKKVEQIRKSVYSILREETDREQHKKTNNLDR